MESCRRSDEIVSELADTSNDKIEEDDEETYKYKEGLSSPSKRLNVELMSTFKNSSMTNHEEFEIELVNAGFEVISLKNKDGYDGFINPIRQAIANDDNIATDLGLICMATRCKLPIVSKSLYNPPSKTNNNNNMPKLYPGQVIIQAITKSNKTLRKDTLVCLVKFCNDYNKSHPLSTIIKKLVPNAC